MLEELCAGESEKLDRVVETLAPDLFIINQSTLDAALWGLFAQRHGIQAVYCGNFATHRPGWHVPPANTSLVPSGTWSGMVQTRLAWARAQRRSLAVRRRAIRKGKMLDLDRDFRRLARRWGYPTKLFRYLPPFRHPVFPLPTLLLSPEGFDFPGRVAADLHYTEAPVDPGRSTEDFPWHRLDPGKALVYASLGTLRYRGRQGLRASHGALVEVADRRRDLQFVLAVPDRQVLRELRSRASGCVLVERAPQVELLQRASLAIQHAGVNTVLECAHSGVPMVSFPLSWDQHGNAARVAYHGLGVPGSARELWGSSPEQRVSMLSSMIDRVLTEPSFRQSALRMSRICAEVAERDAAVRAVEAFLPPSRTGNSQGQLPEGELESPSVTVSSSVALL